MIRIAINGFGRIGRSFLRSFLMDEKARKVLTIVAINVGPSKIQDAPHLFKYDSLMGTLPDDVRYEEESLVVDGLSIPLLGIKDPNDLPWARLHVDWVVEATGLFTTKDTAMAHIKAGAKKVVITAPAKQADSTIVLGVNNQDFDPVNHQIVSLASCTTNALAPMLKVLHEEFGINDAMMNTIHSYTNSQVLLDVQAKGLRESRAATMSIIPSSSGATAAIAKVYPALAGKVTGLSLRVPIGKISIIDVTFSSSQPLDKNSINTAFQKARDGKLHNILDSTTLPLVSIDYTNNPHSVVIDELLTDVCGSSAKVFGWYDNEFGYACRIKDFLVTQI